VFDTIGPPVARLAGYRGTATLMPQPVRCVLVVETWAIGDVVLATPFLAEVRAIFHEAWITFLGRPHATAILTGSGLADEVVGIELPWTAPDAQRTTSLADWRGASRMLRDLRKRRFDVAFESRMDPRGKLVLGLVGARRRVGLSYGGANWLLTDAVPVRDRERHRVDDWFALLAPFGGATGATLPALRVSAEERQRANEWLRGRGVTEGDRVVAVHPGASSASKRWPIERFAAVINSLVDHPHTRVLVIVDPEGYGATLSRIRGVVCVQPDLRRLMALLTCCSLLVGNDSGPMHLAAALGTSIVGVFHAHAAREFAPLGARHAVLSPPAIPMEFPPPGSALLTVTVDAVVEAAKQRLPESVA
jgi:heptosyltransferase III